MIEKPKEFWPVAIADRAACDTLTLIDLITKNCYVFQAGKNLAPSQLPHRSKLLNLQQ